MELYIQSTFGYRSVFNHVAKQEPFRSEWPVDRTSIDYPELLGIVPSDWQILPCRDPHFCWYNLAAVSCNNSTLFCTVTAVSWRLQVTSAWHTSSFSAPPKQWLGREDPLMGRYRVCEKQVGSLNHWILGYSTSLDKATSMLVFSTRKARTGRTPSLIVHCQVVHQKSLGQCAILVASTHYLYI